MMKKFFLSLIPLLILPSLAFAGDHAASYFTASSGLVMVGFKDKACGPIPTPFVNIDGESNCAKVPNTWVYKLSKSDGTVTKEVRQLTATWKSTETTEMTGIDGRPVLITNTLDVVDGRSVLGAFGRQSNWAAALPGMASAFSGNSDSSAQRYFATGLAATRMGEGASDSLSKGNNLVAPSGN